MGRYMRLIIWIVVLLTIMAGMNCLHSIGVRGI